MSAEHPEPKPHSQGPGRGGPASGVPARGYKWRDFEKGNAAALKHGSYAKLALAPRADEIAAWLRSLARYLAPEDEPALQLLGLLLAQLERAAAVLGEIDETIKPGADPDAYLAQLERRAGLSKDARSWANSARNLLNDLALTPAGRQALEERVLTVVHVTEVQAAFSALYQIAGRYVERERFAAFADEFEQAIAAQDIGLHELPPAEVDVDVPETKP